MSSCENAEEGLARKWLNSLSGDPETVCRPRCDPPDYVFKGDIAVEVTRLSEGDRNVPSLIRVSCRKRTERPRGAGEWSVAMRILGVRGVSVVS